MEENTRFLHGTQQELETTLALGTCMTLSKGMNLFKPQPPNQ